MAYCDFLLNFHSLKHVLFVLLSYVDHPNNLNWNVLLSLISLYRLYIACHVIQLSIHLSFLLTFIKTSEILKFISNRNLNLYLLLNSSLFKVLFYVFNWNLIWDFYKSFSVSLKCYIYEWWFIDIHL